MDFIDNFFTFLLDVFLLVPRLIYEAFIHGALFIVDSLPTGTTDPQATLDAVPTSIIYFLTVFEFNFGLTVIFTAYIARFLLRRIPVIG